MLKMLDLFSGIGGFSLAAQMVGGIDPRQLVEIEPYCQAVLRKNFSGTPIHPDARTYSAKFGDFDIATIGYPCQDNSTANQKGKGLAGERSSLWFEAKRIIAECHPAFAIVENVPPTQNRRWDVVVRANLRDLGYHTAAIELSTRAIGGWHLRERMFVVAYSMCLGFSPTKAEAILSRQIAPAEMSARGQTGGELARGASGRVFCLPHTGALRVADGLPSAMDRARIHALGNSVDPRVAAIPLRRVLELHHGQ